MTQSVAGGQTLSFAYDQLSRLVSAGSPLGTVGYQYDLAGRQTRIIWPDAFYAAYEYDVAGALIAVRENGATSGPGVLALYAYDDRGRRASVTRGNGVVSTYAYDSASRLDVLSHNLSGTGSDLALDFSYNSAGQIVARDRTSANPAYVYPQPAPNADTYVSNGLNQIASLDGAGFSYDARGNLTSAGGVSYTYDAFNRLTAVSGAGAMTLSYDPAGRLYETSASGTTTRFLYSGARVAGEYNASGSLLRRYIPGPRLDEHLVWYEGSGTSDRRWFIQDQVGSVLAVTDGSGNASAVNSYDEFGQPAATNVGLFGYTGQMYLSQAGLYHYRARTYSPSFGRFLQTDPIGGLNLYAYVGNDPLNWLDPWGLQRAPHADGGGDDGEIVVVGVPWGESAADRFAANMAPVLIARGYQIAAAAAIARRYFDRLEARRARGDDITDEVASSEFELAVGDYANDPNNSLADRQDAFSTFLEGADAQLTQQALEIYVQYVLIPGATLGAGRVAYLAGPEIRIGSNFRVAPLGNRTGHRFGELPHYHRRIIDPSTGLTRPGGGIGWHRPWEGGW